VKIDLNADVGEGCGYDERLMPFITSANVAAGAHAGNPSILRATVRLALEHGVAIGAHPGFADREGFGRREQSIPPADAQDLVLAQIELVARAAETEGGRIHHVKPHGALYNMAARDGRLAAAIARAIAGFDRNLILFAPPNSELFAAGRDGGLRVAAEVFADRAYNRDGSLVPRTMAGAVIEDKEAIVSRAIQMVRDQRVAAVDGSDVALQADTVCVHGDTPGCDVLAASLRSAFEAAGIAVAAPAR
jgi:UPF0271 protein